MGIDVKKMLAHQAAMKEFTETSSGRALMKFENATVRYWQADGNENLSDKRILELDDAMRDARRELIALLGGPANS